MRTDHNHALCGEYYNVASSWGQPANITSCTPILYQRHTHTHTRSSYTTIIRVHELHGREHTN